MKDGVQKRIYDLCQKTKSIYVKDKRRDMFAVDDKRQLKNAESVVSLWHQNSIGQVKNGKRTLKTKTLMEYFSNKLDPNENFAQQPIGAIGSGFLVKSPTGTNDWIVTAGHCLEVPLQDIRVVFGFSYDKNDKQDICEVAADNVFQGNI